MEFNIYNTLIIAGIIQGFIFTLIVAFSKKYHSKSTFYLVSLIFCYSAGNLMYIIPDIGLISLLDMYNYLYLPFAAIDAPIIYFYVISFLYPSKKVRWTEKVIFIPFIISLGLTMYFRVQLLLGNHAMDQLNPFYRTVIIYTELFSVIFSIILLAILIYKTRRYEIQSRTFNKDSVQNDIKWLKITLIIIWLFTFLWAYLTIRNMYIKSGEVVFYSLWLGLTVMIYWLGHIGIYKYGIIADRRRIRDYMDAQSMQVGSDHKPSDNTISSYKNEYILALENLLINEKKYLDSNLTLESVAESLNLSPSYLSRMINSELSISFPDYLNSYRVKEAERYLRNPDFSKYTITAIGLEAGFNSKSSFYEVFKKATGKTPLSYKKEMLSA
ncbi:AraC-like DNA-binding protein [Flavobacteriaceae bacterium MAR_2010_105]|nr:AraC-like DNA-binding protein [Flavobacteriaceae bacterium MAR_2010_105]